MLPPFMTSSTHRGRDSLSLRWRDRRTLSLSFFRSPSFCLSHFFYLRIFQSLPTPQLLPDPRCSSPLLFLLIYLLFARNLLVRCLLIFSSSRYGPQANESVAPPQPPPHPPPHERQERRSRLRTEAIDSLKNEIEGKEAQMKVPWYDKGRGPFPPPLPPLHIMLSLEVGP